MAAHEFSEVQITDRDYYPLPCDGHALGLQALELAFMVMKRREVNTERSWRAAALDEARLAKLYLEADESAKAGIQSLRHMLDRDYARRLRDRKPQLRVIV